MPRLNQPLTIAVFVLAVLFAGSPAFAQSAGWSESLTLSGNFNMQPNWGTIGEDLASIVGHENGWTVTLYDVTYHHFTYWDSIFGEIRGTGANYTVGSFEFTGPDAALLNSLVSPQLTEVTIGAAAYQDYYPWPPYYYWYYYDGIVTVTIPVGETGVSFEVRGALGFRTDDDGYPILWSCWSTQDNYANLYDGRNGNSGSLVSYDDAISIGGDPPGPPPPPPTPPPSTLAITDVSSLEGNRGNVPFAFRVDLDPQSSETVSVDFRTRAGTALAGKDYKSKNGTLSFSPGETEKTIMVPVIGDRKREPDETFSVELFNAVGAPIDDAEGTGTIWNDDR